MMSISTLSALVFFVFFLVKWFFTSSAPKKMLPPSPPKLPIVGNLHQLGSHTYRSLQSLSKKYGPLMLLHFGSKPVLVASSADAAREIMKTHDLIFSSRPKLIIPDKLLYNSKDIAFAPYGEYWRQVRSICVLHLLSKQRVQSFQHVREEETSKMIEKVRRKCSSSLINMNDLFATVTNDIICRTILGKKYSQDEITQNKITALLSEFEQLAGASCIGDYIPWLAWLDRLNGLNARLEKMAKQVDEFMEEVIEEHINRHNSSEDKASDFVDILLEIQRKNTASFAVDRGTIKAIIMDMLAGGTDTTFSIMEWAMTELLKHPKVKEKLQNEVRQIAEGKQEITENDIEKMQYLKAVIKETLRLHCPVALLITRTSIQDISLMGYDIKAGTQVIINAWGIGRDPSSWKNPDEFQPERFLDSDIDFRGFDFELIPFGAGRRGCPGMSFSIVVNELVLANILYKFNFALPDGAEEKDLDILEAPGVVIHRKFPLLVVATPHLM